MFEIYDFKILVPCYSRIQSLSTISRNNNFQNILYEVLIIYYWHYLVHKIYIKFVYKNMLLSEQYSVVLF